MENMTLESVNDSIFCFFNIFDIASVAFLAINEIVLWIYHSTWYCNCYCSVHS